MSKVTDIMTARLKAKAKEMMDNNIKVEEVPSVDDFDQIARANASRLMGNYMQMLQAQMQQKIVDPTAKPPDVATELVKSMFFETLVNQALIMQVALSLGITRQLTEKEIEDLTKESQPPTGEFTPGGGVREGGVLEPADPAGTVL